MKPNSLLVLALGSALSLPLCLALAAQPVAHTSRGEPIRGEPIGGPPVPAAASVTNAPAPSRASISVAAATNSLASANIAPGSRSAGFAVAGFDQLAGFNLDTGPELPVDPTNRPALWQKILAQMPADVKALNDKPVAIRGFVMPLSIEKGMVTEFILLRSQMGCCFGVPPGLSEWIEVKTLGKGVKPVMDEPTTVYGTLHIGAIYGNSYLTGIYKLDCEKISEPN